MWQYLNKFWGRCMPEPAKVCACEAIVARRTSHHSCEETPRYRDLKCANDCTLSNAKLTQQNCDTIQNHMLHAPYHATRDTRRKFFPLQFSQGCAKHRDQQCRGLAFGVHRRVNTVLQSIISFLFTRESVPFYLEKIHTGCCTQHANV